MVLLFGCRHPSDHIYKAEVEDAEARGAISHYYTAYSRLRKSPKVKKLEGLHCMGRLSNRYFQQTKTFDSL